MARRSSPATTGHSITNEWTHLQMANLTFPDHDLFLDDRSNGVFVAQHGKSYLARKWKLTDQVQDIIRRALDHGLTCLWQEGHPGSDTSHHISFSFSHRPAFWVFCLGGEANPPNVRVVTVSKKVRGILQTNGLDAFWENAGGKNFSLAPEKLPIFLDALDKSGLRDLATLPAYSFEGRRLAPIVGVPSEKYLEDCLFEAISSKTGEHERVQRQPRFPSEHVLHAQDIPDLIIETESSAILCELKLYRAIEPDLIQIRRYMANQQIRRNFGQRRLQGVLVAHSFEPEIRATASETADCSFYAYTDKSVFPLQLVSGADVLKNYVLTSA